MDNDFESQNEPGIDDAPADMGTDDAVADARDDGVHDDAVADVRDDGAHDHVIDEDELLHENEPRVQSPYDRPGRWYVVHFGAVLRAGDSGVVDAPAAGPGVPGPAGGC